MYRHLQMNKPNRLFNFRVRSVLDVITVMALLFWAIIGHASEGAYSANGKTFSGLQQAFDSLQDGDTLFIKRGVHEDAGVLANKNITVIAEEGAHLKSKTVQGKAALVITGDNAHIIGLECSDIAVPHKNGACIRLEASGLWLEKVYFHDSQQGVLSGKKGGLILIQNSRFENLGFDTGQSHGIYIGSGELVIQNSTFIAAKDQGHEIKTRASKTVIDKCIISSAGSADSRLVDVPNGGELVIKNSVLHQGPASVNNDLISFGVEGYNEGPHSITLTGNSIISDKERNRLLNVKDSRFRPNVFNNVLIGAFDKQWEESNIWYKNRKQAGMADYPFIPAMIE